MATTTKKPDAAQADEQTALHLKYRPKTLDKVIGHEQVVAKLLGIIKTKKFPSALAFFGPPSAGKTTLARAFATAINGKLGPDYKEINAADERGIDDVRELVRMSKFRPVEGQKRIIFIDEAHQLCSNNAAAQALLKSLEEPSPSTMWILGSMEQSKFTGSTVGKAMLTRCIQFVLEQHTNADLLKQALRIAKGEGMSYMLDEERVALKALVKASNNEMRTLANLLQSAAMYAEGLEKAPKTFTKEMISEIVDANTIKEDRLAVEFMIGLYTNKYARLHRATMDVTDQRHFINQVGYIAKFMLDNAVMEGQRHPKVWWTPQNKEVHASVKDLGLTLGTLASVNYQVTKVKAEALSFQMPATDLLTVMGYEHIQSQKKAK